MNFVCTEVRFTFFNGKKVYTVEYDPSLRMWYIFDEHTVSNCLTKYSLDKKAKAVCTHVVAEEYLNKYLESIKQPIK